MRNMSEILRVKKELGITDNTLAEMMGVSWASIQRYKKLGPDNLKLRITEDGRVERQKFSGWKWGTETVQEK